VNFWALLFFFALIAFVCYLWIRTPGIIF